MDRYSEDLDFSLLKPDSGFALSKYHNAVRVELEAMGFEAQVTVKHFLQVAAPADLVRRVHHQANLKIKFEIDIDPPPDFATENVAVLRPVAFSVRAYTLPDLFAGKISAILCRQWKHRIKGRDWYDLIFYVARNIPLNLIHLKQRLIQSKFISSDQALTPETVKKCLNDKLDGLDLESAKVDVLPYLRDKRNMDGWTKDLFKAVIQRIQVTPD